MLPKKSVFYWGGQVDGVFHRNFIQCKKILSIKGSVAAQASGWFTIYNNLGFDN
jgi:hypothetical protein